MDGAETDRTGVEVDFAVSSGRGLRRAQLDSASFRVQPYVEDGRLIYVAAQ